VAKETAPTSPNCIAAEGTLSSASKLGPASAGPFLREADNCYGH
jgi:hypothetical protein